MVPKLIAVMGPTASGKTTLAEQLAHDLDAVLINADAFQVYRGLDIGTAKPRDRTAYELIDIKEPNEPFAVGEFVQLARRILERVFAAGRNAIVVGGTGLYVRALFEEYADMGPAPAAEIREELNGVALSELVDQLRRISPEIAEKLDLKNRVRVQRALERSMFPEPSKAWSLPPFCRQKFGVSVERSENDSRIASRVESMLEQGWVEEVAQIRDRGFSYEDPGLRAIGYRTLWKYLDQELKLDEAKATVIAETRKYAKRQRTWLRTEPSLINLQLSDALSDARRRLSLQ